MSSLASFLVQTPPPVRAEPVFPIILSLSKDAPRWRFDRLSANGCLAMRKFQ
jgi:hypothetical protein